MSSTHGQTPWCLTLISSLRVYNISSLDITSSGPLLVSMTWNAATVFSRCQWRYLKFVKKRCPPSRQAHYASLCVSSTWHVPALLSHPPQMTAPLTMYSCNGIWEILKCPSLHFSTRQWLRLSERQRLASAVQLAQSWAWWQGLSVSNERQWFYFFKIHVPVDSLICSVGWQVDVDMLSKTCKKRVHVVCVWQHILISMFFVFFFSFAFSSYLLS